MSSGGLTFWDEPLYCENVCRPEDIIMPPLREHEDKEAQMLRKERIEEIGRRYLDGHCPIILTASLRGPFTQKSGWSNPWRSTVINEEEAVPESSYEGSDYEIEETYMGQVASPLAQESQRYNQQDEGPSRITDFEDQLPPSKSLLVLEDEQFLSSNTNAIIRGEKRSISAEWLKGTKKSKKPRWETPDRVSPTPMAVPASQRKQKSTNTKTPPSKTSNTTPLVNGSFNYVRVAAMNSREGKRAKKELAGAKRRYSQKIDVASDIDKLARESGILPQTAPMTHRRAASTQSAPRLNNISQLSSKAMPLHSSQSTPHTRIPDLQEEFAARIGGSGLAKNFKDHWADLFAKQNSSSPAKSSNQGQPSKTEATPIPGQATEVEDDSDEYFETPQDMEVEPVAPDTHQSESFSKSDSRSSQEEQDNGQHDNSIVLEDISMADMHINQTGQEGESMVVHTPVTHTKDLEAETTIMDQQEQTATQMSIEADETTEFEDKPDHSINQLNITFMEMATPIQAERFQTQDSQARRLTRKAKRRRSRQQSRETKALVKEPSVDRTKSLEAGSATTTPKPRSQRTSSSAVEIAPDNIHSPPRTIHEAGAVDEADQNTQEPDPPLLQDDNELIKDLSDAYLALERDAIDNKYVPDVSSQNLSTPAQSSKSPAPERPIFGPQSTSHRMQVDMRNSQETGSQTLVQSAFSNSTPQRKDTPDATPSDDGLAIPASKPSSQTHTRSASKLTQDRRTSLKRSQETTFNSQRVNASQQSSWQKSPRKSTQQRWQPSADAEASSDEDMEDIPAKRPSSRPLAENLNPGKQNPDGDDSTQKHIVPSHTQSQKSRRKSTSRAWQPPSDAVPSSDDDIGDIPAQTPSQSSPNKSQSARVLRSARKSSQSSTQTAHNPASSANGVHMSTTASSTVGMPSPHYSTRSQPSPNASIAPPYTQSPWAPTANLENLFVSVPAVVDNDLSHSLFEAKQISPEQDKDRQSTPEENFIRPISAFITPSPKKPSQTILPKASFDPLLNPWVSTNPSESKPSTKSRKRVSFVVTDSPSQDVTKEKLRSPPPENPPEKEVEVDDTGGKGEKTGLFQKKKTNQTRTSFESKNSQGSQAPVWAYGEAFREADQLVGAEVEPAEKETNGRVLEANANGGAEREGGFDMQKFLMEGEVMGLDMPDEEYWDAEMYAGGRDLGEGIW